MGKPRALGEWEGMEIPGAVQVEVDSSQVPVTYGMMQVALIHGQRLGGRLLVTNAFTRGAPLTPLIAW